jgi:hypothetical protein
MALSITCHLVSLVEVRSLFHGTNVIIMNDFHNIFAYYGRSKPKEIKYAKNNNYYYYYFI